MSQALIETRGADVQLLRALVLRGASIFLLLLAVVTLPIVVGDDGARALLPYLCILAFLQLAPLFWLRRVDLFAPPVITGVLAALATVATITNYIVDNAVTLDLVKDVDPQETAALARLAVTASCLALASYYLGYLLSWGVRLRHWFPAVRGLVWDAGRMRVFAVGAFLIFAVCYAYFQMRVGGSILDVTRMAAGKKAWRDDPSLSWMLRGIQLGFLPILLYLTKNAVQKGYTRLVISGLALVVCAYLVARMGQRGNFMYVILCALILFHYLRHKIPAALFVALLYVAVLVSNLIYTWRTDQRAADEPIGISQAVAQPTQALVRHSSERQRFAALALIMQKIPEEQEYLLGESWLGLIVAPIPRWLWPEKNQYFLWRDTGIIYQLGGGPVPAGFLGTLYANFSWIGIVLGMFLWGIFHRALYEWLRTGPKDINVVLLYALTLLWFRPTLLAFASTTQYVLPAFLLLKVIGRRPPVQSAGDRASEPAFS